MPRLLCQDALTRHIGSFYIEQHKDEYDGYYPFVYRASLDAQRRQDAGARRPVTVVLNVSFGL